MVTLRCTVNHLRRRWAATLGFIAATLCGTGCGTTEGLPLPNEVTVPPGDDYQLVARIAHISDAQIIDEESPARLTFAKGIVPFAWRPYERYSTQLLDGVIRAINRQHELAAPVDFMVHTGDAVDNHQLNELRWFLDVLDGGWIDPRSGPDDRDAGRYGPIELDAHAPFKAQGLYRNGVHGDRPSIPWYALVGNHDHYALGVFPVVPGLLGNSHAPLPLANRIGLFLPTFLEPTAGIAYGPITPAHPGLQHQPTLPTLIQPNPDRHYYTRAESAGAYAQTLTGPAGHGFDDTAPERTWYSVSPVDGLRLIGLDTCRPAVAVPASFYAEGALDRNQMTFLRNELNRAQERGELAVVLTHHPSYDLHWKYGSAVSTDEFRAALNAYPCVVAHLVGHLHRHRVRDHGGYVEFETASTLDYPQEGRIVEIWKSDADVQLRYWVFSHLPDDDAEDSAAGTGLTADPLREMRRFAFELARDHPVLEGVVPPRELVEEGLEEITDIVGGIGEGITAIGEELVEITEDVADVASDTFEQFPKAATIARTRDKPVGSPSDRRGVIVLPRP